jgi:hypothetical protein
VIGAEDQGYRKREGSVTDPDANTIRFASTMTPADAARVCSLFRCVRPERVALGKQR